jgi:hypothetical protein
VGVLSQRTAEALVIGSLASIVAEMEPAKAGMQNAKGKRQNADKVFPFLFILPFAFCILNYSYRWYAGK